MSASLYDINSPAYKKALRLHKKSKKTPAADDLPQLREQEKAFKARFPPPSLSEVLDLSWKESDFGNLWKGVSSIDGLEEIPCQDGKVAYIIASAPGFVLLPGYLSPLEQRELIRATLENHAKPPNENNLDTHYNLPVEGLFPAWKVFTKQRAIDPRSSEPIIETKAPTGHTAELAPKRALIDNTAASTENFEDIQAMEKLPAPPSTSLSPLPLSSILYKLRWSNIGHFYHWGTKSYQFDRELISIPSDIKSICQRAVQTVPWSKVWQNGADLAAGEWESGPDWQQWHKNYDPDAGIINFYQLKDTLMAHVDRSELSSTSPLVSISLGQSAVFLLGGLTRDEKAIPVILRSGDVLIMSGPRCRRAFHGVPRILEDSLPNHLKSKGEVEEDWDLIADYLGTTRININVRQVFPPGFPYEQYGLSHLQNKFY